MQSREALSKTELQIQASLHSKGCYRKNTCGSHCQSTLKALVLISRIIYHDCLDPLLTYCNDDPINKSVILFVNGYDHLVSYTQSRGWSLTLTHNQHCGSFQHKPLKEPQMYAFLRFLKLFPYYMLLGRVSYVEFKLQKVLYSVKIVKLL